MPLKQLNIRQSDIYGHFELSFQLTEAHHVRRAIITRAELCALMTQADRILAREPSSRK
jgi:hypothetical protein